MKKNFAFFVCMLGALSISVLFTSCGDDDDSGSGSGSSNEYVDLGLSVKWATCNLGASKPSAYGNYYAWGETKTKSSYTSDNCATWDAEFDFDISGNSIYDAARSAWGGSWRMPSLEEVEELIYDCDWTWTTTDGHKGYLVTGPSGKSIFLPAAGWRDGKSVSGDDNNGSYWTGTPYGNDGENAFNLYFRDGKYKTEDAVRSHGQSIRPVRD